jgi:hypothetical protein
MKIEVTSTSVSKKGTVWLQVKVLEGETPATGECFNCEKTEAPAPKEKKGKKNDNAN